MSGSLKSKQFTTTVLMLLLMASAAVAQSVKKMPHSPRPQELMNGKVTKVTINERTGIWGIIKYTKCPSNHEIDGVITTNGPAVVKYTWRTSNDRSLSKGTLTFSTAGSKERVRDLACGEGPPRLRGQSISESRDPLP
jgi:hypothetical protein